MTDGRDRTLTASEAAWLLRVNDDTVRKWFQQRGFPLVDGSDPAAVRWADLDHWCVVTRRARPFDAALLDAAPDVVILSAELAEFTQSSGARHGSPRVDLSYEPADSSRQVEQLEHEISNLKEALRQSQRREQAWRLVLRERVVGAAAADRALTHLLDAADEGTP